MKNEVNKFNEAIDHEAGSAMTLAFRVNHSGYYERSDIYEKNYIV